MRDKNKNKKVQKDKRTVLAKQLRITPDAWCKLCMIRNERAGSEVAFIGVTTTDDPMLVDEIHLVKHYASAAYVEFDDDALHKFTFDMIDERGLHADKTRRVWIHTHPGNSAAPSQTDWNTVQEHFAGAPYGIMLIVAMDNSYTCHMVSTIKTDDESDVSNIQNVTPMGLKVTDRVPRDFAIPGAEDKTRCDFNDGYWFSVMLGLDYEELDNEVKAKCLPMAKKPKTAEEIEAEKKRASYSRLPSIPGFQAGVNNSGHNPYGRATKLVKDSPLAVIQHQIDLARKSREARSKVEMEQGASVVMHHFSLYEYNEEVDWMAIWRVNGRDEITKAEVEAIRNIRYNFMTDGQVNWIMAQTSERQFKRLEGFESEYHAILTKNLAKLSDDDAKVLKLQEEEEWENQGDGKDIEVEIDRELSELAKRWEGESHGS